MSDWDGSPVPLSSGKSLNLPQTTNGSMFLMVANTSKGNDAGTLRVASGGGRPKDIDVPAGTNQYLPVIHNWKAQNLQLTNTSLKSSVVLYVAAYGPGLNPKTCSGLVAGTPVQLRMGYCASGEATPQWLTLRFEAPSGDETLFGLIGGPPQTADKINAYTFALNANTTVPPKQEGVPVPEGYYQQAAGNRIDFAFKWGSSSVWVVNLSSLEAATGQVSLST